MFDDPAPGAVWTERGVNEYTGRLGAVFGPFVPFGKMSGHCMADTSCSDAACLWQETLGGAIQGAVFIQFISQVVCSNWQG